ncbi:MAG TPA: GNAT family N-acetyltransferase [Steroidobacteraceae bacterium]|nr:GNAT family N-acetyltransferase [Steroidobacteraceae bacterium]
MAGEITLHEASWAHDRLALESVRRAVFIEEQRVPEHEEWDAMDAPSRHVLALDANRDAVGTGRLDPTGKIGRVAVLPQYRGRGIGVAIVRRLVGLAESIGLQEVHLNAQVEAVGFYERLGFRPEGPVFDEVGILHRRMRRKIGKVDEQRSGHGNPEHPVKPG